MRNYRQMMDLILRTACDDSRIRAVVMNGSRANPNAPQDMFQDYDIVYIVRDLPSLVNGDELINAFGGRIMLQTPETMRDPIGDGRFTYLALLDDGNRIDLQLIPADRMEILEEDSESILLLDKEGLFKPFPPASDSGYHVRPPDEKEYDSCCNNFWWCMQNVAKGIWRDEMPYAIGMFEAYVRAELNDLVSWHIGLKYNYAVSVGKLGKYFKRLMSAEHYEAYAETYCDGTARSAWKAVFTACALFRTLARPLAAHFGYAYPEEDDARMSAYLKRVSELEPGADAIF